MEEISSIVAETPWWVYVIFLYLIFIGIKSTRPRIIPVQQLFILPIVFFLFSLVWLYHRLHGHVDYLLFWLLGIAVGSWIGYRMVHRWNVRADRVRKQLHLPPSWTILVLVILVFAVRYFFGYQYAVHPEKDASLFLPDALISGTILGTFLGRAFELYRKYKNDK